MTPAIFVLLVWAVVQKSGAVVQKSGAVVQKSGSAAKPALTFRPNYSPIFVGEGIRMNCEAQTKAKDFTWFYNGVQIFRGEVLNIGGAETRHSGDYQCATSDGTKSDKVTLSVAEGRLVLQTAPYIHEGDRLSLKCHHNPKIPARRTKFTRNNTLLRDWDANQLYSVANIQMNGAGTYTCTKELTGDSRLTEETARASVRIRELFTTPIISWVPSIKNLTCNTEVSSYKPTTEPHYGFYKNKELVRAFTPNNAYEVPANQLRAPGAYSCAVRPKFSSVTKTSKEINISESTKGVGNAAAVTRCECALLLLITFILLT